MRISKLFLKTYYDDPADAEIVSHKLMVRGGYITRTGSGIYTMTPLMWRTVRKIMSIICSEMDRAGAQEILMPILQPFDLWKESGRLEGYLKAEILFHLSDRRGGELALGPTHEEVVTDLVRRTLTSHKDLPVTVYQQQMKFRDEIRPRFGLMRGREFMMKDAYSFDVDSEGLDRSYDAMSKAYHRIFDRIGLDYVVVDADSGAIGDAASQEFMVTAAAGEDELLMASDAGHGANVEKADSLIPEAAAGGEPAPMRRESTPNIRTVEELCTFFESQPDRMVKTVLYKATYQDEESFAAVLMRGDRAINEVKLTNVLGAIDVDLADDDAVRELTGAEPGFAGPIGLKDGVRVIADRSVEGLTNFLCGANETDFHCLDVNIGRDFQVPEYADVRLAVAGDRCVLDPGVELASVRGIEVGHIFKLGTKYSEAMDATVMGRDGKPHPLVMGCYGIGTTRIAAAAVEQNSDADGIVWPYAIAPYHAVVMAASKKDEAANAAAQQVYDELWEKDVETLLDDRGMGVGARLKDAELIGIPFRILVGRGWKEGLVEIKCRRSGDTEEVKPGEVLAWIEAHR